MNDISNNDVLSKYFKEYGFTSCKLVDHFKQEDYSTVTGRYFSSPLDSITDFLKIGWKFLAPISLDLKFDPTFYALTYFPQTKKINSSELYFSWLNTGIEKGFHPNLSSFLKSLELLDMKNIWKEFDYEYYLQNVPELKNANPNPPKWIILEHCLLYGILKEYDFCPSAKEAPNLYLAVARRLDKDGDASKTSAILEKIILSNAETPALMHFYADSLIKQNRYFEAVQNYKASIDLSLSSKNAINKWSFINASNAYTQLNLLEKSVDIISKLVKYDPGDENSWSLLNEYRSASFQEKWEKVNQLVSQKAFNQIFSVMDDAVNNLIRFPIENSKVINQLNNNVKNVILVANLDLPQCELYRVEQKIEQLKGMNFEVSLYNQNNINVNYYNELIYADIVIFYRVPAFSEIVSAIDAAHRAGIPTFYDIDDLIFNREYYPGSLESYNGYVSETEYGELIKGVPLFAGALKLCDYAMVSTLSLAKFAAPLCRSGRAFVHRNAIGEKHINFLNNYKITKKYFEKTVNIFYGTGTKAHSKEFFDTLQDVFANLLLKHKEKIHIILMGYIKLPASLLKYSKFFTVLEPSSDINAFWNILSQIDINLAVLNKTTSNDCKSEIKWLEAAMLGIPSVVSRTNTYEEVIEDGVDGFMASTKQEWFNALDKLVQNKKFREKMGEAAKKKILESYTPEARIENLEYIFNEIRNPNQKRKKKPLRILIVAVFFSPQLEGGATRVVVDNVRDLMRLYGPDIEIEVFTTLNGGRKEYEKRCYIQEGVKVTAVTAASAPNVDKRSFDPKMGKIFGQYLDYYQPDIVHFHCIQRLSASVCQEAYKRNIPYLITAHDGWWISENQFLIDQKTLEPSIYDIRNPTRLLENNDSDTLFRMQSLLKILHQATYVLTVSEKFAEIYRNFDLKNVVVTENGVSDLKVFPYVPYRKDRVRLAQIGGASAHKGFTLLQAALMFSEDLDNLELTVIDHALPSGTIRYDQWGKTPVTFISKIPQSEVGRIYAKTDVLVACSLWPESYGLVAKEATLSGCWVIASDRGAIGDHIDQDTGFVIDVSNTQNLYQVLKIINDNPEQYTNRVVCKKKFRRSEDQAKDLFKIYSSCLNVKMS